jgi:hypothetical protein
MKTDDRCKTTYQWFICTGFTKGPSLFICCKKYGFYQAQILKGPESFPDCIKGISVE